MSNPEERSMKAFELAHGSKQRFEYFLAGIIAALTAYLGKDFRLTSYCWSVQYLDLVGLVFAVFAFVTTLIRLNLESFVSRLNHKLIYYGESAGTLVASMPDIQIGLVVNLQTGNPITEETIQRDLPKIRNQIKELRARIRAEEPKVVRLYRIRNRLLVFAVAAIALARILAPAWPAK